MASARLNAGQQPGRPAQVPALFDALVSVGKQNAVAALKEAAGVSA